MNAFSEGRQRIKSLPRKKRLCLIIGPLILIGIADIFRAHARNDNFQIVVAAVIFFIIAPIFAIVWDRLIHR